MSSAYERELHSWDAFPAFLKNENRELFKQMLSETKQFLGAFNAKEQMPQEAFLMTVFLVNQRMIAELEQKVGEKRRKSGTADKKHDKGSLDYYLKIEDTSGQEKQKSPTE